MTIFYPDVSNNQWSSSADLYAFLSLLAPQGFAGVAHKMSEGSYYEDPYGALCQEWCQQNGLPFVGYHYVTEDDPADQVETWLDAGGGTVAMFDWEANGGDLANFYSVASAFNAAGVSVQLGYCPQWYWDEVGGGDFTDLPVLVSSAYPTTQPGYASSLYDNAGGDDGEGWDSYGNAVPGCWQFTDGALIGSWSVDCNAYRGTDTLDVVFGQAAPAPDPTPTPTPTPADPSSGGGDLLSGLTQAQQEDIYNYVVLGAQQLLGELVPPMALLPGSPTSMGTGWGQQGQNSEGQNLTTVDALSVTGSNTNSIGAFIAQILQLVQGLADKQNAPFVPPSKDES